MGNSLLNRGHDCDLRSGRQGTSGLGEQKLVSSANVKAKRDVLHLHSWRVFDGHAEFPQLQIKILLPQLQHPRVNS